MTLPGLTGQMDYQLEGMSSELLLKESWMESAHLLVGYPTEAVSYSVWQEVRWQLKCRR